MGQKTTQEIKMEKIWRSQFSSCWSIKYPRYNLWKESSLTHLLMECSYLKFSSDQKWSLVFIVKIMTDGKCDRCGISNVSLTIYLEGPIGYHLCPDCSAWAIALRAKDYERAKRWYWRLYWRLSKSFRRLKFRIGFKLYLFRCFIFRRHY